MVKKRTKKRTSKTNKKVKLTKEDSSILKEIGLILIVLVCALIFMSNIGLCGTLGEGIKGVINSIFGPVIGFLFPFLLLVVTYFNLERDSKRRTMSLIGFGIFLIGAVMLVEALVEGAGGNIAQAINSFLVPIIGKAVVILLSIIILIVSAIVITGKPMFSEFTLMASKKTKKATDAIGREALEMAKNASSDFSRKIEEAKLERCVEKLNAEKTKNIKDNPMPFEEQKEKIEEVPNQTILPQNNNTQSVGNEPIQNNVKIPFSFFKNNKKSISETQSNNIINFNDDIKKELKVVIEKERNVLPTEEMTYETAKRIAKKNVSLFTPEFNTSQKESERHSLFDGTFSDLDIDNPNVKSNVSDVSFNFSKEPQENVDRIDDADIVPNSPRDYGEQIYDKDQDFSNEISAENNISFEHQIKENDSLNQNTTTIDNAEPTIEKTIQTVNKKYKEQQITEAMTVAPKQLKPYKFPPISYLERNRTAIGVDKSALKDLAAVLQNTLEQFGVGAKVTNVSVGPSITRFELQPEIGVRVSKITSLEDDLKLALAAREIRIEAPIPGKQAIGIEIPNTENSIVCLGDLVSSKEFKEAKSNLTVVLGKDVAGKIVLADLAKMPHLLIAGATGSGKSICINSIIVSLLYKSSPEDVQIIMVDPKVVELQGYNGIPHLFKPVVTDAQKANQVLKWAVNEMEHRYVLFANHGVKDIEGYNKVADEKMPKLVIIIDELADLMMAASKEVENSIVRIAQLARACGMHLIIATQRPMATVVTGLIKANVPSRIAFAVSSSLDSRIILDTQGAEKLLGKGDMLFSPIGSNQPTRVQGCYISEDEIEKAIDYIRDEKLLQATQADTGLTAPMDDFDKFVNGASSSSGDSNLDELFRDCAILAIQTNAASAGNFQRKFQIGFNRAARIIDQLEENNVVGPQVGKKPREVLMTLEEFNAKF